MLRPNEKEEEILLSLIDWINEAREKKSVPNYVLDRISTIISSSWRNPDERKVLCSNDIKETKDILINKYKHEGEYSELLKTKLFGIKDEISRNVYDYYWKETESIMRIYGPYENQFRILVLMESGWLPKSLLSLKKIDWEKEADIFIDIVKKVNKEYNILKNWFDENIFKFNEDERRWLEFGMEYDSFRVIERLIKEEFTWEKAKEALLEKARRMIELSLNADLDIDMNPEQKPKDAATFYPNQEKFYHRLEVWASSLKNPDCKRWLSNYLTNSRNLPFYQIKVFRYIKDFEEAKEYLIKQYEHFLRYKYDKRKKYLNKSRKYNDIRFERHVKFYKQLLKESGEYDFNEELINEKKQKRNESPSYPIGYVAKWAHDVVGYSDDEIDTIFDGDPDAYWNID